MKQSKGMKKGWTNYFGERGEFVDENAGLDKLEGPSRSIIHSLIGRLEEDGLTVRIRAFGILTF